jgi:exodeoxyribonuclease V alpha subunit
MTTLNVTVERVAYPPATADAEAWYILICDRCSAKGRMQWRPQEKEQLILDGEWTVYKGSTEFSFKSARLDVPTAPRDMLRYVCARTTGMGPASEEMIWQHSGLNWMDLQEGVIPRINGKVYQNFRLQIEALRDKSEEAKVVAALCGRGATANMAQAAWETWKLETLGVVQADCFRLAELPSYGFKDVDKAIRQSYGIADDDPRRIRAAVIYSLRRLTDRGDTVVGWTELYTQTVGMLGGYAELVSECTSELFENGTLKAFPKSEGVSLASDWFAEKEIWNFVEDATK